MPDYLPAHRELVLASGVAEIIGGAAVMPAGTRRPARWWLPLACSRRSTPRTST